MEFEELLELVKSNPQVAKAMKSLIQQNRPYRKTEDVSLCLNCQQNPPEWLSICGPCLDNGEES